MLFLRAPGSRGGLFTLLRQGVKVVPFFRQQALFDQSLDDIKNSRPRIGIVPSCLKQLVQIERLLAPVRETPQNLSCQLIHNGVALTHARGFCFRGGEAETFNPSLQPGSSG